MESETDPNPVSLKWFEIWRSSFLRPTIQTFSRIINDPKASAKWGIIWMAITTFIVWVFGPQRDIWWGMVADQIGLQAASYFVIIGAVVAPILGVFGLLLGAALAHAVARLFDGAGTFQKLVYCWGVMQLPFLVFSGLVIYLFAYTSTIYRLLSSGELDSSMIRMIILAGLVLAIVGILYLFYAQAVAFSAVEKFGIGKGIGILMMVAIFLGIARVYLSSGLQALIVKLLRY